MAYASLADLQTRCGKNVSASDPGGYDQLTDRVDATTASDTVGTAALAWGSERIDAKIGVRYAVPVDTSSSTDAAAFLKAMTLDLAEWRLWSSTAFREAIPQRVVDSFNDAVELLREIADGKAVIPSAVELAEPSSHGDTATSGGRTAVLTETNMANL